MLLIAKLVALGVVVWFYMTADKLEQPPVKWAVIGLIGYMVTWLLVDKTVASTLSAAVGKRSSADFFIDQIPALAGFFAAFLVRKKLISDAAKHQ